MAESDIDSMIAELIKREGGFTDKAADRGGPTNMGITLATLAESRGQAVTVDEVRALSEKEAAKIYRQRFYADPRIDSLPEALQPAVLDAGVMSGPKAAIEWLQRVASVFGREVAVDGVLGSYTVSAVNRAIQIHGLHFVIAAFTAARVRFYRELVEREPAQAVFLAGWIWRARGFLV